MKKTLFALLLLTSCGYHFGTSQEDREVTIPYVKGDDSGLLTAALVRQVNHESDLHYKSRCADYEMRVCLSSPRDENVGFWYAPKKKTPGAFTNIIVPMEAKLTLTAKVEIYNCQTNTRVFGPCKVTSFLEYDFNSDLTNINDHTFSLGQLEMHNIAKGYAMRSAFDLLAEKIVDTVAHAW
ncbi:MAG: hypothetical protein S4CHLAM81_12410 [Chlamydiales bacterium]|nr:hypothetical protein [Chlamydiales bacterium]MCH9636016.1 hypothetical protein [Chlamydiales bacterium]MCH9704349.1 hypothetical protein [Chlamydiota bacterium]